MKKSERSHTNCMKKTAAEGGRELENWLEAERIVMARRAQQEKGGKVKTPAAAHQAKKTPVRAKASKAAAQHKEPVAAGAREPRVKKTAAKKPVRPAK